MSSGGAGGSAGGVGSVGEVGGVGSAGGPSGAGGVDDSAAEVLALLTRLSEWTQRAMPAPPSGHAGPECQWCPLCQLASALRGEHPEITDRMAEAATAVSGAVRSLLESARRSAPDVADDATVGAAAAHEPSPVVRDAPPRPARRPRPRIEHIDLDDTST